MEKGSFRSFVGGQLNVSGKALIKQDNSNYSNDFSDYDYSLKRETVISEYFSYDLYFFY